MVLLTLAGVSSFANARCSEGLVVDLKLTIELVPKSSWYKNVRSEVPKSRWEKLKQITFLKAGYKCEICGGVGDKWPVECHETWSYVNNCQTLENLVALCPKCHEVKHVGFAEVQGNLERALEHLAKVNDITLEEADEVVRDAFWVWEERNLEKWEVDISWLDNVDGFLDVDKDGFTGF